MRAKNKDGKIETRGQVRLQIDILPAGVADKNPVGKARDNPNHSPFLPQPEGRIEFSLNPLKMFNQLIGPAVRRKIYMMLCCLLCIIITVPAIPNIVGGVILKMLPG